VGIDGQLGDGPSFGRLLPGPVAGSLSGITAISAGDRDVLALQAATNSVFAWGDNEFGQLGTNTTTSSSVPVQVQGIFSVVAISASGHHSLGVGFPQAR